MKFILYFLIIIQTIQPIFSLNLNNNSNYKIDDDKIIDRKKHESITKKFIQHHYQNNVFNDDETY